MYGIHLNLLNIDIKPQPCRDCPRLRKVTTKFYSPLLSYCLSKINICSRGSDIDVDTIDNINNESRFVLLVKKFFYKCTQVKFNYVELSLSLVSIF